MEDNKTTVYRAIYVDEIDDYKDSEILKEKYSLGADQYNNIYRNKNTFDYEKIAESLGIENCKGFLHFFSSKNFACKYVNSLLELEPTRDALVCAFSFDKELLEKCEGKGFYSQNSASNSLMDGATFFEIQTEYAIPIEKYDPQENFVEKIEDSCKAYTVTKYDPDQDYYNM